MFAPFKDYLKKPPVEYLLKNAWYVKVMDAIL